MSDVADPDDLLRELFGEPIYRYTDDDAVRDGLLIPFLASGRDTGHRVTANAYSKLKQHYQLQGYDYTDQQFLEFFLRETLPLVGVAAKEYAGGGVLATDLDFRVTKASADGVLWYLPNERRGVTVMLPSDY